MALTVFELAPIRKAELKKRLLECSHNERVLFAKMYGPQKYAEDDFFYNVHAIADHHIDTVVDGMPDHKLEWARLQVERTIQKREDNE